MKYFKWNEESVADIAFLVPQINIREIIKEYIEPIQLDTNRVLILDLFYDRTKKKTPASVMKQYINEELVPVFKEQGIKYVVITDAEYFKVLTKQTKADPYLGYVLDSPYGEFKAIYIPNTRAIFYNPEVIRNKIKLGLDALNQCIHSSYQEPGKGIIHDGRYPNNRTDIICALDHVHNFPVVTCDIETFSLKHYDAGIASITFCWDKHSGICFAVDDLTTKEPNKEIRALLKKFFKEYKGTLIFHNIAFDAYILIYQLFMDNLHNIEGMYEGMEYILDNFEDTKLITYLATNSCARAELGLKAQAQEYAGNYAVEEIGDVTKLSKEKLLEYNLIDGLSTWYVYEKNYPKMVQDSQLDLYTNYFKPFVVDIIQTQLTGMPLNPKTVLEVEQELIQERDAALNVLKNNPIIISFDHQMKLDWVEQKNNTLKKKRVNYSDAVQAQINFNPASDTQLSKLLYKTLELPVLDLTESKAPAVGAKTLAKLINHTEDENIKSLLQALIDLSAVQKILTAFIPAMKNAVDGGDGRTYLFGSFNLGGTVSGRLSSNNPNLQQIPATGSKYAKVIKKCFEAPEGWLFCGLDYNALEARIDALVTKDPAKLAIYDKGYDSHSYNAYHYYTGKFSGITLLPEQSSLQCYSITIDGQTHYLHEGELIELSNGTITTIENAYNLLSNT